MEWEYLLLTARKAWSEFEAEPAIGAGDEEGWHGRGRFPVCAAVAAITREAREAPALCAVPGPLAGVASLG